MKLSKIINSKESFNKLVQQDIPASKGFEIVKWYKKLEPELSAYDEQRKKLILTHTDEDTENKEMRKFTSEESAKKFQEEMKTLDDKEVENPIKLSEVDLVNAKLSISDIVMLDYIIE